MYLLELNSFTGLIKEDAELDGYLAIESFRILVNKEGYGLRALTCVALVMDYGSIIKSYSEKERPLKAMEIVFNNRKALNWNCDEIQLACINYKQLQPNPVLEEKMLLNELRITKLEEIKNAETTYQKTTLLKELANINDLNDSFDKKNGDKDTFAESPVRNGYKLLRLEIKILDPKSFYYERKRRETEAKERELEEQRTRDLAESRAKGIQPPPGIAKPPSAAGTTGNKKGKK